MNKRFFLSLILLLIIQLIAGQNTVSKIDADILEGFINPPRGYGEVPFYWWQGDTLTKERISWQLDQLEGKGISSLQINYSHRDFGGLIYGLSNPSKPPLFSEAWWDLFRWFSEEASRRGMTISLSDYTIGVGQGFAMDEAIRDNPELNGYILGSNIKTVTGKINTSLPENLLLLNCYKLSKDSSLIIETKTNLLPEIKKGRLAHNFGKSAWKLVSVYAEHIVPSFDPMNPVSGKAYNSYFFDRFEKALHGMGKGKLNFFFSDELNFRLSGNLWNKEFAAEFMKMKGYDLVPTLDAVFIDGLPGGTRTRLDYNDVIVKLSEKNFFEPVYRWHEDRGLIFGCDHGGRGREVTEFGDYFRTQRWNQGPGSDQPRLSKDIIKAKVASSISHLYNRPRVWLEGFHSSGWGTSSADVTDAILANFVAGYNLLSFHGFYYSTMGGWWEWAPPDNHFRMPYWKQINPLMDCVQRLSFLLSQGQHRCDVAILYPVEPVVAGLDGDRSVETAFDAGEKLYDKGIDFDFLDFESLARAEVKDKSLNVSGEKYKVLVIPSMKAIRYSSLEKISEFLNGGGVVVNIGSRPKETDMDSQGSLRAGELISEIFSQKDKLISCNETGNLTNLIEGRYMPGFRILTPVTERPYVMKRVEGRREIYAIYNLQEGTECFFASTGRAQLWSPWNGSMVSLANYSRSTEGGTLITLPLTRKEIQVIVFDPEGDEGLAKLPVRKVIRELPLGDEWEFTLRPSLDNKWGDYKLPASDELIGAEVSQFHYSPVQAEGSRASIASSSDMTVTCGFGPQFLKAGPLAAAPTDDELIKILSPDGMNRLITGNKYHFDTYEFSWKTGVEGDYGHQGYHGLKGEMYDNFIRLGAFEDRRMSLFRTAEMEGNFYILAAYVSAPANGEYDLLAGSHAPARLLINNTPVQSSASEVILKKGLNSIVLLYDRPCETYLVFRKPGWPVPVKEPVSMRWFNDTGVLPFVCPGPETAGNFEFGSSPGLDSLVFSAYGKTEVLINGVPALITKTAVGSNGLSDYLVKPGKRVPGSSEVTIRINFEPGYSGAAAIPSPVKQFCGTGMITLGDWSAIDGLKGYSGGAWYRNSFTLDQSEMNNEIEIDLGDLVASAEVFINGKSAGIKPAPPYRFMITGYARTGKNDIEVLVYNTLANHFISIPTRYRGEIKSGLSGPVKVRFLNDLAN